MWVLPALTFAGGMGAALLLLCLCPCAAALLCFGWPTFLLPRAQHLCSGTAVQGCSVQGCSACIHPALPRFPQHISRERSLCCFPSQHPLRMSSWEMGNTHCFPEIPERRGNKETPNLGSSGQEGSVLLILQGAALCSSLLWDEFPHIPTSGWIPSPFPTPVQRWDESSFPQSVGRPGSNVLLYGRSRSHRCSDLNIKSESESVSFSH